VVEWYRHSCSCELVVQLLPPRDHKSVELVLICSFFQNLDFKTDQTASIFHRPPSLEFMPQVKLLLSPTVSLFYVFHRQEARRKTFLVSSLVEVGRDLRVPSVCECELGPASDDTPEC
jgi:hypothetical protein